MSPSRHRDLRRLLDLVGEADVAALAGTAHVVEVILDRLPSIVPCDIAMYVGPCDEGSAATDPEFTPFRQREQTEWNDCCAAHHPKLAHWDKNPTAGAVRFSDVISRRALRLLPIYNYFWRPFEINYDLGLKIVVSPGSVVYLSCACRNRDLSDDNRATFDALRPYAAAIFRRAESSTFMTALASRFGLSQREGEVLAFVAAAKTNKEIAAELFVSAGTVRTHLERIYAKLGVRTRTEAASVALEVGFAQQSDAAAILVGGTWRATVPAVFALTSREVQVLERVALGATNQETGAALGIATNTVRTHLEHIYAKLGVRGRTDAAVRAVRLGLVSSGSDPSTPAGELAALAES